MILSGTSSTNQALIAWAQKEPSKQAPQPSLLTATPEQFQQLKNQNSEYFSRLNAHVEDISENVKKIKELGREEARLTNRCSEYSTRSQPTRIALKVLLIAAAISLIVCDALLFNPATFIIGAIGLAPMMMALSILIALQIEIASGDSERKRLEEVISELDTLKAGVEEKIGNIDHLLTVEDNNLDAEIRKTSEIAEVITLLETEKSYIDTFGKFEAHFG